MLEDTNTENIFFEFLKKKQISFIENFELKKNSWLKAGGTFRLYIQPKSLSEIKDLLNFFIKNKLKFYVVGNLSNVIFRDGIIKTPIINLKKYNQINVDQSQNDIIKINVCCGISIFKFVTFISNNLKISGLEGLVGIPGSIGGAIYMNASSYDSYISEFLKEVEVVNKEGHLKRLNIKEIEMEWRSSIFHKMREVIILNAIFEFPNKNILNTEVIKSRIHKNKNHRIKFQEKKSPNLGSLFATKDLYKDLCSSGLVYKLLYIFNKISTKIILKISNENSLLYFRKILVLIYSFFLNIKKEDSFILSNRTINCLINNGSSEADKAIKVIRKIQEKIGHTHRLENILIEEIE